jgi:hypothetical protein
VSESRVLRRIFEPKEHEVMEDRRKLNNEGFHTYNSSTSIIRFIKLRRIKWAAHVTYMLRGEMHAGFLWESQKKMNHLHVSGIVILR